MTGPGPPPPDDGSDPRTDIELLRAHVAGDTDAFGVLYSRHRDRMWALALRTLRDPDEASDAVQDATISAFRRASTFRGEAAVGTWLHRIVVNACLDRLRRRRGRAVDLVADDRILESLSEPAPDESERRQTTLDVQAALAGLPPDQRAALLLVDMAGYSIADAADLLDCAPGTVKSRCARGRARLVPVLGNRSAATDVEAPMPPTPDPRPPGAHR